MNGVVRTRFAAAQTRGPNPAECADTSAPERPSRPEAARSDSTRTHSKAQHRCMAIKKSDLYASLWAGGDQLRGGMDASQYKGCVLFMLFIKYISDKYAGSDDFAPPVVIPSGASFKHMVALKGITETFRALDSERCEIVATLYAAWSDLLRDKGAVQP